MAVKIERIVEEDLNLGIGPVDVTMPAGGTVVGHKIGIQTFNALAFIATVGGGQSVVPDDVPVVIRIDTEELDVANWFDPLTFRLTPTVPGRFQIDGYVATAALTGTVSLSIYKNGTEIVANETYRNGTTAKLTVSALVSLDGVSDYVTLRIAHDNASAINVDGARISGFMTGKYDVTPA